MIVFVKYLGKITINNWFDKTNIVFLCFFEKGLDREVLDELQVCCKNNEFTHLNEI